MSDPPASAPLDLESEPITSRSGEPPPPAQVAPYFPPPSNAPPSASNAPPVGSAPLSSAQLSSAPLSSAPLSSAPLSSAPLDSAPLDSAPIAAMPIIELGVRANLHHTVEVDSTGVHRSAPPPRGLSRSSVPASASAADDEPITPANYREALASPPDADLDEEGYLRSDALHTLLDPSELNGTHHTARFALQMPRPAEGDDPDIPVEIGADIDESSLSEAVPSQTAPENSAPIDAGPVAPSTPMVDAQAEQADASALVAAAADDGVIEDEPESLEAHDAIDVDLEASSEPKTPVAAPLPVVPTTLSDPESHKFDEPDHRSSEAPTEVDPDDMEIEEVAAAPANAAAPASIASAPGFAAVAAATRSTGAEIAAAVQAQNANEMPAFKRTRYWWDELFGDDFLRTMDKLTDAQVRHEVNFIEESLAVQKSGIVLDLACGSGRHAVEMASRGYNVVGYDLSVAMLARAADEAQSRKQKLNFLHGDMRDMGFEEMFDGIYCWSTSFGYFDDEKNLLVAQNIHRALRKGGMFLLDLANRDFVAQRQPSLVWFEGEGCVCMDEMRVDFITSRLKVKRMVMLDDGRSRELDYSIRLYTLHELGRMLHEVGFKVTEVSGQPATPGVFMGADSPRMIVLAEKA